MGKALDSDSGNLRGKPTSVVTLLVTFRKGGLKDTSVLSQFGGYESESSVSAGLALEVCKGGPVPCLSPP